MSNKKRQIDVWNRSTASGLSHLEILVSNMSTDRYCNVASQSQTTQVK